MRHQPKYKLDFKHRGTFFLDIIHESFIRLFVLTLRWAANSGASRLPLTARRLRDRFLTLNLTFLLLLLALATEAQQSVSIGSKTIKTNAVLYLNSPTGDQGVIVPVVQDKNAVQGEAGLIVYEASTNTMYYHNGSAWIALAAGTSGTVTRINTGNTLTGGPITTTGTLDVNVGTGAGQIPQLDNNGKLVAAVMPNGVDMNGSDDITVTSAAGGDLTGNYPAPVIGNSRVTTAKIVDGAVSALKLNADVAGTGMTQGMNGALNVDVGTTANKIVQLDANGRLPAVDGSQLTNLPDGDITGVTAGTGLTGGASSGDATLHVNTGTGPNQIVQLDASGRLPAVDGSQLTNLPGGDITGVTAGTGLTGGASSGDATLHVNTGTGPNQIVQLDATAKLPSLDGSQLMNLDAANITAGTLPVVRGGSGITTTPANGQLLIGNGTGYTLTTLTAGTGVNITNGTGTVTISASAAALALNDLTDVTATGATNAQLLIKDGTGDFTNRTLSGDATLDHTGVLTITNNAITSAKISDGTITHADLAAASVNSLTIEDETIRADDLEDDAVTTEKIRDGEIVNADVSAAAAIDGSKVNPDFGAQNISTTGSISAASAAISGTTTFNTVGYTWPGTQGGSGTVLTNNGSGGLSWQPGSSGGWQLSGNAGTDPAASFLGTTDNVALTFKVNNTAAGKLDPAGPVFFGYQAGSANTAAQNTGMGHQALYATISGNGNTASGYQSLYNNTTGPQNSAYGAFALYDNITGGYNTALGHRSLYSNIAGNNGTAIGNGAMRYTNSRTSSFDNRNVAVGFEALRGSASSANNTGNDNTAVGSRSLLNNAVGYENTAIGSWSLYANQNGYANTANGYRSLYSNIAGYGNTGLGSHSLHFNTTGTYNTATGSWSLFANQDGSDNTANGYRSLYSNIAGYGNTGIGAEALEYNTNGRWNTALGNQALRQNTDGEQNTGIGTHSLLFNQSGNANTAVGSSSLFTNANGSENTAVGVSSLIANNNGNNNTAVGYGTLRENTSGTHNTAVGHRALYENKFGNGNIAIGALADVTASNLTNATAIGYNAKVNASNRMVLGTSGTTVGGYSNWTNYSDRRLKENIEYVSDLGLNFITRLRPATYHYKEDDKKRKRNGLIAQDVQEVLNTLGLSFSGLIVDEDVNKTLNLSYGEFVMPLITAVQQQQAQIEALKTAHKDLEQKLQNIQALLEKAGVTDTSHEKK